METMEVTMFRLAAVLWVLVATVLAGSVVTALLTLNLMEPIQIAGGALVGALVAIPIAWIVGKRIYTTMNGRPA